MDTKQPLKVCKSCNREFLTEADFFRETSRWRICDRGHLWFNCSCNSTQTIVKGKFDWYSPDLALSQKAQSVFNTLPELKKLPRLPSLVMELQQLIQDESVSAAQLAKACRKDPILAGNILKIANKLRRSQDAPNMESLAHAITYIGLKPLGEIILTASVNTFTVGCSLFKAERFWEEAFLIGQIAEKLARRYAPHVVADEAYLAGALCEIGKLVTALCFPLMADTLTKDEMDPGEPRSWALGEKFYGFPSHTILGEIGASVWGLPEFVIKTVPEHDQPPNMEDPEIQLTEVVGLASQLHHWIALEPTRIDQKQLELLGAKFKLKGSEVEQLVNQIIVELKSA